MAGMFATIKTFVLIFAYFAAFQLGKMNERPKAQWPKAGAGQNPWMVGAWAEWQKVYLGVVALAILLTLVGPGGMGGFGGFGGGGMGGGYY
jgi:hypothetical protein